MASLRNAIPQRPYRERAQPGSRAKLGILEKHKDYSARAKDYNAKKARLKILRQKATDRNPDEFHFGMMSSRTKDGIKLGDRGAKALSQEVVKLMKTQDAGYLRTIRERVRRERMRLKEALQIMHDGAGEEMRAVGGEGGQSGKHIVFVEDKDEQANFDSMDFFGTDEQGLSKTYNRPRKQSEVEVWGDKTDQAPPRSRSQRQIETELATHKAELNQRKKAKHDRQVRKAKLVALEKQEKDLLIAENELEQQRARMAHTVGGVNKNGIKFKLRERLR